MDFRGYVDKGWIRPSEPISLPDGTPVTFSRATTRGATGRLRGNGKAGPIGGWKSRPLRDLVREQGSKPLRSLDDLAGDWPPGESIDALLRSVRKGRA